jgi:hypothetical protein
LRHLSFPERSLRLAKFKKDSKARKMSLLQQPLGSLRGLLPRSLSDILPSGPGAAQHASTTATTATFLPLLGLITSASALTFAYAETTYLTPLQDERVSAVSIRTMWEKSFPYGLGMVLSLGVGSFVGGIAGYRLAGTKSTAKTLYAVATGFSLAHFAFVPSVSSTCLTEHMPPSRGPSMAHCGVADCRCAGSDLQQEV